MDVGPRTRSRARAAAEAAAAATAPPPPQILQLRLVLPLVVLVLPSPPEPHQPRSGRQTRHSSHTPKYSSNQRHRLSSNRRHRRSKLPFPPTWHHQLVDKRQMLRRSSRLQGRRLRRRRRPYRQRRLSKAPLHKPSPSSIWRVLPLAAHHLPAKRLSRRLRRPHRPRDRDIESTRPLEATRRLFAVRNLRYLEGDELEFTRFKKSYYVREMCEIVLPGLEGQGEDWPGISREDTEQQWRRCKDNRAYIDAKRQALAWRTREVRPKNAVPEDPVEQTRKLAPLIGPRNRLIAAQSDDRKFAQKRNANALAKRLAFTGLRYRRWLGHGGNGYAALFEARRRERGPNGERGEPFNFVVKVTSDTADHREQLAAEKAMMRMMRGARHIVQCMSAESLAGDINRRKRQKRKANLSTAPFIELDEDPLMCFTEYMNGGDLQEYIGRMRATKMVIPKRGLWHILRCLVYQAIALEYPPSEFPDLYLKADMAAEKNGQTTESIPPRRLIREVFVANGDPDHRFAPTFKLGDFGLAEVTDNDYFDDTDFLTHKRATGKSGCLTPEQFSEEWDYYAVDQVQDPDPETWTAGRYKPAMNVWQLGQVMQSVVSMEIGLVPSVPVLYYVRPRFKKKPDPRNFPSELLEQFQTEAAKCAEDVMADALSNGQGMIQARQAAASAASKVLDLGSMKPEDGIRIFPYDHFDGFGWLWTYAALMEYEGTADHRNNRNMNEADHLMHECICRMMAHRPSDRPQLNELKQVVDDYFAPPGADAGGGGGGGQRGGFNDGQAHDEDMYTDSYVKAWNTMLFESTPTSYHQRKSKNELVPFPEIPSAQLQGQQQQNPDGEDDSSEASSDAGGGGPAAGHRHAGHGGNIRRVRATLATG
ncbi:Protein kinase-like domain protein [Niveomyces insectorum RCEF 264]|uniref:Protein kinase-like domain protein n=1 Tax=Niveomyces insectorum RCEF 264 TaxID=1081102 RepID=A0A167Y1F4_9HYPO|nr:Protein kinase-like domain protein [Niveomyces insectorum RCEF 264]